MAPVAYRFRAELRRRRVAWLGLGVVVGLAGGIVLGLLAGARRTDSAYDRFVATHNAADLTLVSGIPGLFEFAPLDFDAIAGMPEVRDSAVIQVLPAVGRGPNGAVVSSDQTNFGVDGSGRYGTEIERFKVLDGRRADPDDPGEIVVSFPVAERLSLAVGDTFRMNFLDPVEAEAVFGGAPFEEFATAEPLEALRVVGIVAVPGEFPPPPDLTADLGFVHLTPALLERHADAPAVSAMSIRLTSPEAGAALIGRLQASSGGLPVAASGAEQQVAAVNRALRPLSRALFVAALLAAAVAALVIGQILTRQAAAEADDVRTLGALGFSGGEHRRLRLLKGAVIGGLGAVVALATAIALSPFFPIGLARNAEPDPGVDIDTAVVVGGAVAVLAATILLAALAAILRGRARVAFMGPVPEAAGSPSGVVMRLTSAAPGPVAQAGAGLATAQASAAGSLVGIGLGLVTVVAMLTFIASLGHLRAHPPLYGWTWDLTVGGDFGEPLDDSDVEALAADPRVATLEVGTYIDAQVAGRQVQVLAVGPVKGEVRPAMVGGRAPQGPDEIALAPDVARDVDIGDVVPLALGAESVEVEVVGRAVLPEADVLAAFEVVKQLSPDSSPQLVRVDLEPGTDVAAFAQDATETLGLNGPNFVLPQLPQDLVNFGRADAAPVVIGGLMGLVAVATLFHALLAATQRGRRTLAVLRALGFTARQLLAAVAWQAALLVLAALVVAVPLGIALGRWSWVAFAHNIGVVARPTASPAAIALTAGVALLIGALIAAFPGWRAGRVSVAAALRTD